ncbi:MAG: hypothetical protein LBQ54_14525 [Planctomycetaceae bacterium]|jgi:hypothetical protein|nr:hypothetical protein [Planctomycetaceae bacterium]
MKRYFFIFALLSLLATAGCSRNIGVSGRVTFPDGSPLTQGFVIFESGPYQVFGRIDESGNYRMGEDRSGQGIKPGEYNVRISAQSGGGSDGAPLVRYVAVKYENTATSGLVCSVQGKTVFDMTVEKP